MKTNLFKRWIGIFTILLSLLFFFGNGHLNAQDSLNLKEQKELITDHTISDTQKSENGFSEKLKSINDFFDEHPIVLLLTLLFGAIMSLLKGIDLTKKLFPKWFKKKLKPFKKEHSKYFKILIVPSRDGSEIDDLLQIVAIRFKRMHKDEGLDVITKETNGKFVSNNNDAVTLGDKYDADMVVWVDYFKDNNEAHIAYNLITQKKSPLSNKKSGEIKVNESLARIKEGFILGDIDDVMYTVLGLQSYFEGDYLKSIELLNQVKEKSRKTFKHLGNSNYFLKKYDEAQRYYKKNLEIRPNSAQYNYDYAISLEKCQKFNEAERYYKKAIEIDSSYGAAYGTYASLLQRNKNFELAERYYKKAIELKPESFHVYNNYALFLEKNERLEEAEKYYKEAIKRGFEDLALHINYARLNKRLISEENKKSGSDLIKSQRPFQTILLYDKAVRINPNSAITRYHYASFLKAFNSTNFLLQKMYNFFAKKQYKKAIKLDPSLQSKEADEYYRL